MAAFWIVQNAKWINFCWQMNMRGECNVTSNKEENIHNVRDNNKQKEMHTQFHHNESDLFWFHERIKRRRSTMPPVHWIKFNGMGQYGCVLFSLQLYFCIPTVSSSLLIESSVIYFHFPSNKFYDAIFFIIIIAELLFILLIRDAFI